mgnify:CR=1 FL=1
MFYKNKFDKNYWLRKIYTSKLFQLLPINSKELKKKIFTSIYKSNHWVQNGDLLPEEFVSVSGHGSNVNTKQHLNLMNNFNEIIKKYKINSILDMPCGDFLWIRKIIENENIEYLGIDIVEELINKNKENYKKTNINFQAIDIIDFQTNTKFDLVLIRDLFIHIKNSDIVKILNNLKSMNIKYVILNSYNNEENKDVTIGQHRKINLLKEPFNLSEPIHFFNDYEDDKFCYLYDLNNFN